MKAFKEWLREDSIKIGYLYDEEAERQRKKGWRGALEEVLKQIDTPDADGSETIQIKLRWQTIDWIKEELGEE